MAVIYNDKYVDNVDILIKRFRKEVEDEAIIKELKNRQYFIKSSKIKKQERKRLEKRLKRKESKRRNSY